jgi:hypothetical protein
MGTAKVSMERPNGLYVVVAVLRGGSLLPMEVEAPGPLAAQDAAEMALGRRSLPVVEVLGSIERMFPRTTGEGG